MAHCTVHTILCRNAGHKRRMAPRFFFLILFFWRNSYLQHWENMNTWHFIYTHRVLTKLNWVPNERKTQSETNKKKSGRSSFVATIACRVLISHATSSHLCEAQRIKSLKFPLVDRNLLFVMQRAEKCLDFFFNDSNTSNKSINNHTLDKSNVTGWLLTPHFFHIFICQNASHFGIVSVARNFSWRMDARLLILIVFSVQFTDVCKLELIWTMQSWCNTIVIHKFTQKLGQGKVKVKIKTKKTVRTWPACMASHKSYSPTSHSTKRLL